MDGSRFDHLTRSLAAGASRRSVIKGLLGLGGAAIAGAALATDSTHAARRPTPTPTPPKCPGKQIASGGQCVCPNGLSKCGPDCCNPTAIGALHSECCDNACCFGECYGEELCCPIGSSVCNARACCEPGQACCTRDDCCTGACYANQQFCCPEDTGEICGDDCCDLATERCCERTGGPICIPIGSCCIDSECPDDQAQCLAGYCNPQTNQCEQRTECATDERCCPAALPGATGSCVGLDDCCASLDCNDPPPDMVCPVASCVANECAYQELCSEDTFCCAGEICCPNGGGCCGLPDGSHSCVPECCDDSNCKIFELGTCVRPRCDAEGFCHYDDLCADDQFCCADEICCGPGGGCCTLPDGTHKCVPECCDASHCKNSPDECSTPVCLDDGTCDYIGCPEGQVCSGEGLCQCANGSVICNGICADFECCGDDDCSGCEICASTETGLVCVDSDDECSGSPAGSACCNGACAECCEDSDCPGCQICASTETGLVCVDSDDECSGNSAGSNCCAGVCNDVDC